MLSQGQTVPVAIEKPAAGGRMIARVDGQVVLVADAIPGERVQARVERIGKGVVYAQTLAVEERSAAQIMAANPASGRPHLAFVNSTSRAALETLDRVAQATSYTPTIAYPNTGFGLALRTVAGAIVRGVGSRVYWVQTGGFDTHAQQGTGGGAGYGNLMGTLGDGLWAFYSDVRNQGLINDTTIIVFSEFGRRISENGSGGTDHGAAGVMMAIGGMVRGGLHGTAPVLAPGSPTLENSSGDVRYETDFRSVYARVLDQWLGVNSVPILNGDFRAGAPAIF